MTIIALASFERAAKRAGLAQAERKNVKTDLSADERKQVKSLCKELLKIHRDKKS